MAQTQEDKKTAINSGGGENELHFQSKRVGHAPVDKETSLAANNSKPSKILHSRMARMGNKSRRYSGG